MTHMKKPALLAAILAATAFASLGSAQAQQAAPGDDTAGQSELDLAKKLQNPIGDLYSFPFQSNTNFGFGPHNGTQEILNIQPVIPIHINEDWNVITRTILPLVWNPDLSPVPSVPFGTGPTTFSALPVAGEPDQRLALGRRPGRPDPDHQQLDPGRLQRLGRRPDRRCSST